MLPLTYERTVAGADRGDREGQVVRRRSYREVAEPGERGATAVEFALVSPLLLTLLFGVFEFGRAYAAQTAVTTASREAARFGSALGNSVNGIPQFTDCAAIRDAARDRIVMAQLADADIQVSYDTGPSTAIFADCDSSTPEPDPTTSMTDGTRVIVDVTYVHTGVVPLLPASMQSVTITSRDTRSIFTGVAP